MIGHDQYTQDETAAIAFMAREQRYEKALRAHRSNKNGYCVAHTRLVAWPCVHAEMALKARIRAWHNIPRPREAT